MYLVLLKILKRQTQLQIGCILVTLHCHTALHWRAALHSHTALHCHTALHWQCYPKFCAARQTKSILMCWYLPDPDTTLVCWYVRAVSWCFGVLSWWLCWEAMCCLLYWCVDAHCWTSDTEFAVWIPGWTSFTLVVHRLVSVLSIDLYCWVLL